MQRVRIGTSESCKASVLIRDQLELIVRGRSGAVRGTGAHVVFINFTAAAAATRTARRGGKEWKTEGGRTISGQCAARGRGRGLPGGRNNSARVVFYHFENS